MGLHVVWVLIVGLNNLSFSKDLKETKNPLLKTSVIKIIKNNINSKNDPGLKDRNLKTKNADQMQVNSGIQSSVNLKVELALTPEEQEKGLMFRTSLETGSGMLFVFPDERPRQFWMKNTLMPLSVAFIDEGKTIFQISDLEPVKTLIQTQYDRAESIKPAKYVLEVTQGWFLVNKIDIGSTFSWPDEKKFIK